MITRVFTTATLCCLATALFAQASIDSLWQVVEETEDSIVKADALNSIAYALRSSNPDSSLLLSQQSERLARLAEHPLGIADAKMYSAIAHTNLGNFYESLKLYLEAQTYFEEVGATERVASCINNIGRLYSFLGENDKALGYYVEAAKRFAELRNETEGIVYNNIGYIYKIRQEYDLSLQYLRKSWKKVLESSAPGNSLFPIYNIGSVHMLSGQLDSARIYLDTALLLSHQSRNNYILSLTKIDQGQLYLKLNQIGMAEAAFKEAYAVASSVSLRSEVRDAARYLSDVYEKQNRHREALEFHKTYKATNDSLFNRDLARRIAFQEAEYEYNQLQTQLEVGLQKEKLARENELANAIWIRNTLIAGFLALSIFTYILLVNFKRKREDHNQLQILNTKIEQQAKELKEANHEVTVMNNNLEKIVNQRTEQLKLRNKQLKEYLSSNSHIVRAPLARIMGLVDLYDPDDTAVLPFINENLQQSANELDNALRSINDKLSDEQEA